MQDASAPIVTGLGVASALGLGKAALREGLYRATDVMRVLTRDGRQLPHPTAHTAQAFVGAEIADLPEPSARIAPRLARSTGLTGRVALAVLEEAWQEAELDAVDPTRIGLVVGGANLQARELLQTQQAHAGRLRFLRPSYGYRFMDTDLCGLCCEAFGIRGSAFSVGGASASGSLAIIQAAEAIRAGRIDVCIALGALQDLSYYDLQGFTALGAMASMDPEACPPGALCRPFDRERRGFVFGEMSAALVLRRAQGVSGGTRYGRLLGSAHTSDAKRSPEPSAEGEARAIATALHNAQVRATEIDFISTHGTGSPAGDDAELAAYRKLELQAASLNSLKSIVGHGLSAAGALETAALLLQMHDSRVHATRNLRSPIDPDFGWVTGEARQHPISKALKLSLGFGGINLALVWGAA